MSDDAPTDDQTTTDDAVADDATPDPVPDPPKANDVAKMEAALAKANREAQQRRQEAKELGDRLKALEDEKLSESERVAKERDDLKAENERIIREAAATQRRATVLTAASKLGFADPDDASALIPADADDVDAALQSLATSKPYLLARHTPATGPQPGKNTATDAPRESDDQRRRRITTGSLGNDPFAPRPDGVLLGAIQTDPKLK